MKTTRTISTLFSVFVLASAIPTLATGFPDVPSTHLNYEAVMYVQSEGIVKGYPDGGFGPGMPINRAEFSKILARAIHTQKEIQECNATFFPDVPRDAWYTSYICIAKRDGLISGYPDGTFKPDANINFAEAAKIFSILFNTLNTFCSGLSPIAGTEGCKSGDPWYEWYVRSLENRKAIPLSIQSLDQRINRGEMAEILWRLRENPGHPTQTYHSLTGTVQWHPGQVSFISTTGFRLDGAGGSACTVTTMGKAELEAANINKVMVYFFDCRASSGPQFRIDVYPSSPHTLDEKFPYDGRCGENFADSTDTNTVMNIAGTSMLLRQQTFVGQDGGTQVTYCFESSKGYLTRILFNTMNPAKDSTLFRSIMEHVIRE